MADDDLILRIDHQTFADDSFTIVDPRGLVVVGQVPQLAGLTWHQELVRVCGPDLKWAKVRHRWPDLSADLRRAVMRDLRDALISVVDPSLYRFDLKNLMINAVGQPESAWPAAFRDWAEEELASWEIREVLADSPASRIQRYLTMPDILLGDDSVGSESVKDESPLATFSDAFQKPHNARLFGARSAAAFADLFDRQQWIRVIEDVIRDMRYVGPGYIGRRVLAVGERTQRVFDEGNAPSVLAIGELKNTVRTHLENEGLIVRPDRVPQAVLERSSAGVAMLQAADLAAGYARDLYLSNDGIKRVCEEFKGVILNGSMVRDWAQVDRRDTEHLRTAR